MSRAGRTMSDSHTSSENRRKGEKGRWTDCKSRSFQDGQRRSPRLTSTSHDECNKQPNSNPTAPTSSGKLSASECKERHERQKHGHLYHEESWLPEKHILELALDTVQRRDTHDIFAEPVDPSEVEEYYEIITEPMDFGTMRAKLYEGLYKNLQQFEHDMYLIFENAMYFNSSGTVYFRQARTLEDLANKVFHALKTHGPDNFELEFSTMRRRSCRKLDEHTSSTFGSSQKLAKDLGSNSMNTDANKKGNKRRRRPIISCIDRRCTYEPWKSVHDETNSTISSLNCDTRPVIHVNQENYRKSLMSFVKGLGPTAQRVAERKLQGLWMQNTTSPIPDCSDCSTANPPHLSNDPSHFQTDLNNLFDRSVLVSNSHSIHEKTGVSMIRPAPEKGKLLENVCSSTRIPLSNPPSQFQMDLNNPFYQSIPVSNPHYVPEKTDVSITGATREKGKIPVNPKSLNSKDANSSANLKKSEKRNPDLRNGTIVMGLVASRNRQHRNASVSQCAPAKESKQNHARKFDLNQAQPSPTPNHVSKRHKEDGSMARATPFGSLAPAEAMHNNMAQAAPFGSLTPAEAVHNYMARATPFGTLASAEAVHNNMARATPFRSPALEALHNNMALTIPFRSLMPAEAVHKNMAPLFSRQFLFNEPYLQSRMNGIGITSSTSTSNTPTMLSPRLGHGSSTGWPMSSSMSFGQASSSRECPERNEYHEKNNRLFNFKL